MKPTNNITKLKGDDYSEGYKNGYDSGQLKARQETIDEKELELLIFIYNRLAHLEGGYDLDYIIKLGKLLEKLQEMKKKWKV